MISKAEGQAMPCRPGSLFLKHDEQLLPSWQSLSQPQNVFPTKLTTRIANSFPQFYLLSFILNKKKSNLNFNKHSCNESKLTFWWFKQEQKLAKGSPDWRQTAVNNSEMHPYHSHVDLVGWVWWTNWMWFLTPLPNIPWRLPELPSHLHCPY